MSDLISSKALIKRLQKWNTSDDTDKALYNFAMNRIIEQPTVDAVPVVYGKWKKKTDYDDDNNAYFECSNCHHGDKHAKGVVVPFCWFCGASMKKGE